MFKKLKKSSQLPSKLRGRSVLLLILQLSWQLTSQLTSPIQSFAGPLGTSLSDRPAHKGYPDYSVPGTKSNSKDLADTPHRSAEEGADLQNVADISKRLKKILPESDHKKLHHAARMLDQARPILLSILKSEPKTNVEKDAMQTTVLALRKLLHTSFDEVADIYQRNAPLIDEAMKPTWTTKARHYSKELAKKADRGIDEICDGIHDAASAFCRSRMVIATKSGAQALSHKADETTTQLVGNLKTDLDQALGQKNSNQVAGSIAKARDYTVVGISAIAQNMLKVLAWEGGKEDPGMLAQWAGSQPYVQSEYAVKAWGDERARRLKIAPEITRAVNNTLDQVFGDLYYAAHEARLPRPAQVAGTGMIVIGNIFKGIGAWKARRGTGDTAPAPNNQDPSPAVVGKVHTGYTQLEEPTLPPSSTGSPAKPEPPTQSQTPKPSVCSARDVETIAVRMDRLQRAMPKIDFDRFSAANDARLAALNNLETAGIFDEHPDEAKILLNREAYLNQIAIMKELYEKHKEGISSAMKQKVRKIITGLTKSACTTTGGLAIDSVLAPITGTAAVLAGFGVATYFSYQQNVQRTEAQEGNKDTVGFAAQYAGAQVPIQREYMLMSAANSIFLRLGVSGQTSRGIHNIMDTLTGDQFYRKKNGRSLNTCESIGTFFIVSGNAMKSTAAALGQ